MTLGDFEISHLGFSIISHSLLCAVSVALPVPQVARGATTILVFLLLKLPLLIL